MSRLMLRAFICGVVILATPFFVFKTAQAEEVIQDFDVTANVHRDGTVNILEKITVNAEGNQIRHGIFRDIPTKYTDTNGRSFHMPFTLNGIFKDNQKEPYHLASISNGQRIYIGDKNKYVTRGTHTYTIQYQVARVIGFFPDTDEFYWNVTGNGWDFPIEKASITIHFPESSRVVKYVGYTGPQGSRAGKYKGLIYGGGHFKGETTARLNPREGFTVATAIPTGIIQKETTFQQIKYFFKENSMWLIWMSFAFLSLVYLFQSWVRYGRDVMGVVIPRFDTPENIAPDLLRYICRQSYDIKAFATLIVNAATHHKIKIEEGPRSTNFILNDDVKLRDNKVANLDILIPAFMDGGSFTLPKSSFLGPKVDRDVGLSLWGAQQKHRSCLENDSLTYIEKNRRYVAAGCLIGILGAIWAVFLAMNDDQKFFLILGSIVFYVMVFKLFWKIMPQYTLLGQNTVEHAEGLKMYMKTAEKERMNALYPKDMTPEKFEKLLPYAIALDVEQEWCDYIDALVKDGTIPPQSEWTSGRGMNYHYYGGGLNKSLTALSSAISSATTAPGRSSGFGSGGSSGGGGGGGGGGGW